MYSKGLPHNNIRYRSNKSPDSRDQKAKNAKNNDKKISVIEEMQQMKQRREDRKKRIEDEKQHKKDLLNDPNYIPKLDYDFEHLINLKKSQIEIAEPEPHSTSEGQKIYVCVRKRPIFDKEIQNGEIDCVSAINPKVCIYDCKLKIDGYTKYIDTNDFYFDNVFNENEDTNLLFECSVKPSLDILLKGGVVTCFAYGQTGSGKTYTMKGIQDAAIYNIFDNFSELKTILKKNFKFYISFFEIYSGRLYDLLNNRNKVMALEDKNQKVQIYGLTEKEVFTPKEMQDIVDYANAMRTTHNTVTNETSSRSHAICNFTIKIEGKRENEEYAKLSLVDLAGSERATETQSNNKSRLAEGAEINKSLLALKECIRALDVRKAKGNNDQHVPFRNSKLTLVLRDSFLGKADLCKIIMISCVSPSNHSSNHTINTLRYADRLKEKTSSFNMPTSSQVKKNQTPQNANNNNANYLYKIFNSNNTKNNSKIISNKLGISVNSSVKNTNFGLAKKNKDKDKEKEKEKEKRDISEGKTKNDNIGKKLNNFFDDIEELDEDNMQKLNLKPTPINEPIRKKTYLPKNKNRFALQKKTKTDREKNSTKNVGSNNSHNDIHKFKKKLTDNKNDELIKNKIKEEDFDEPKEEKMLINKENEEHEQYEAKKNINKNEHEHEIENDMNNGEEQDMDNRNDNDDNENENDNDNEIDEKLNNNMIDNQNIIVEQENLIGNHMDIIKSEAKLLTEEGNLISKIKGITEENYSMEEYVPKIEDIIQTKLNYFKELKQKIKEYKSLLE